MNPHRSFTGYSWKGVQETAGIIHKSMKGVSLYYGLSGRSVEDHTVYLIHIQHVKEIDDLKRQLERTVPVSFNRTYEPR